MQVTKFRVIATILVLLVSSSSYFVGRTGVDLGRVILESRCSAGAFITHTQAPSSVQADAHSDQLVGGPSVSDGATVSVYKQIAHNENNLMVNGGLETPGNSGPLGWEHTAFGSIASKFSIVPGDNSAHALRVDVSRFNDGTADWYTKNVKVRPGSYYEFTDTYRSDVSSRAELMLKDSEGKSHYISLDTTPASSNWSTYTQRFFVPMNVSEILISHPLASIGWLETDNYSLVRTTPDQYNHALVSLTFDDGWESIHQNALPLMKRYGITSTQYLVSGFLGQMKEYMSQNQVYDFENAGHEIASHTVDHPDLTQLTSQAVDKELNTSRDNLTKCYAPVTDFAPPFGAVSGNQIMKVKGLYQTSRSTQDGFNSKDTFNPFELKVQNIRSDTSPSQISAWLETAKMNHVWLILVYHQVIENGGEFSRSPRNFESDLQSVIASGITVKTVHGAFTEVSSQVSP